MVLACPGMRTTPAMPLLTVYIETSNTTTRTSSTAALMNQHANLAPTRSSTTTRIISRENNTVTQNNKFFTTNIANATRTRSRRISIPRSLTCTLLPTMQLKHHTIHLMATNIETQRPMQIPITYIHIQQAHSASLWWLHSALCKQSIITLCGTMPR